MTLFNTASELLVRLMIASEAELGDQLVVRAQNVRDSISTAVDHYENVQSYRSAIAPKDSPSFKGKKLRQSISGFRRALSTRGTSAFQQNASGTLQQNLQTESRILDKWVMQTWSQNFDSAHDLLLRAQSGELYGSPRAKAKAETLALKINAAKNYNPVKDRAELEKLLKVQGVSAYLKGVNDLIEELRKEIAELDQLQATIPPEAQDLLKRSASDEGIPLSDVTPEVLAMLRSADLLGEFVVRRS